MNGFTGSASSFVSFSDLSILGGRGVSFAATGFSKTQSVIAGSSRRRFRIHGEWEYMVVANNVAPQLSRKSTKKAGGV